jgi:hypothetical protein
MYWRRIVSAANKKIMPWWNGYAARKRKGPTTYKMMAGKGGRRAAQRIVTLLSLGVKPLAFAVV